MSLSQDNKITPQQYKRAPYEPDILFNVEEIKNKISPMRRFLYFILRISESKFSYFTTICGLCLARPRDERDLNQFRKKGYSKLNSFIKSLNRRELNFLNIKIVIWCCLNLVSYFEERYRERGCKFFTLKNKLKGSRDLLTYVLELEMPEKQYEIIRSCISYFTRTRQWNFEDVVLFVFQRLLMMATKEELVVSKLIKEIEICQREVNLQEAQTITASLSLILEVLFINKYHYTRKLQDCFSTLLKVYLLSDGGPSNPTRMKIANVKFRIHIKNCIRQFISKIRDSKGLVSMMDIIAQIALDPETSDDEKADLTEMISHCAQQVQIDLYEESITPRLLNFLLINLKSSDAASVLASQKIWHYLLDRQNNMKQFTEPIYHFKGRSNFIVNVYYRWEDVYFFKSFSQDFFGGLYQCLDEHTEIKNLVSTYKTICLVLVEVPDPIITMNMIHVVIKAQDKGLKSENNLVGKYHIHAVVASILSLICLIHGEEVSALGKYVQEVVIYRNENSPHLLPPLNPEYNIAKHHTTEYHRKLYFLEEEVLCALKQCWLGRRRSN